MAQPTDQPAEPIATNRRLAQRWQKAEFPQRRELIIDAALALLRRHGLKAVTMRRVAQRLGVGAMTLYTYINGQHELHREMVRRGFAMLRQSCNAASTLGTAEGWRGGARAYVHFAIEHPNLYRLMFDTPMSDLDLLHGGFQPLLDKVRHQLAGQGLSGDELDRRARASAGRFWIGLHGLATLAIAGRLVVLGGDLEQLLDNLLERIAPSS